MREAARELLQRQHDDTGAPLQCTDPAVYAAVAKLLREPEDQQTGAPQE